MDHEAVDLSNITYDPEKIVGRIAVRQVIEGRSHDK